MPEIMSAEARELTADRICAMRAKELSPYCFKNFYRPPKLDNGKKDEGLINVREDIIFRQKICHWVYSVVDHYELSRQTVEITMDLFDRFLATLGNRCDSSQALLISLTALYIAIKMHESQNIRPATIAKLSRDQFFAQDIEVMELEMLTSLSWLMHPPTTVDFLSHLLMFLPTSDSSTLRHQIFQMSRYMAELSICDPYFIEVSPSITSIASILNVLEDDIDYDLLSTECREKYILEITTTCTWFTQNIQTINECRDRLRYLLWEQEGSDRQDDLKMHDRSSSPTGVSNSKHVLD